MPAAESPSGRAAAAQEKENAEPAGPTDALSIPQFALPPRSSLRGSGPPSPRTPRSGMEMMQELIPLAKEMMAQKPTRKLVKLYVLGGVLAFLGVVLGLMETVCSAFTASSRLWEEEAAALRAARERQAPQTQAMQEEKGKQQEAALCSRALSKRQHAS